MRIYGIDLGTRRLAIACPEIEMIWSANTEGSRDMRQFPSEFDAGCELGRRLLAFLFDWQHGELADTDDLFVAERPFVGRPHGNVRTAIGQALSGAAALAALPGRVKFIEQALWKKALCDNGAASKADIRRWVEGRHPALSETCGEDQNRFDAVGIALGSAALALAGDL